MTIEEQIHLSLLHDNADWLGRILSTLKGEQESLHSMLVERLLQRDAPECLEQMMKQPDFMAKCREMTRNAPPFCLVDRNVPRMLVVWLKRQPKDILLTDPMTDESLLMYVCRHLARLANCNMAIFEYHWLEAA